METMLAASFIEVAAIVLAILGTLAIGTVVLKRRRRDVWQKLARRRRLQFDERSTGPRLTGQLDGRRVEIALDDVSSDRDVGGVEVVRLSVELPDAPQEMSAEGVPGLIGDLAALAEQRIDFEPEEFNRDVLVQGSEPAARTYWNDRRKHVFLELVQTAPCDQVVLRDQRLIAELREILSDHDRLEQLLDQLLSAASALDDASSPDRN